jgi:hypothetical protein
MLGQRVIRHQEQTGKDRRSTVAAAAVRRGVATLAYLSKNNLQITKYTN